MVIASLHSSRTLARISTYGTGFKEIVAEATAESGKIEVQLTAQKECAQQARITHKRHASGILNAIF